MAYAVGDVILWASVGIASPTPPARGVCVVLGANPEVVWLPSGTRAVMTGLGAAVALGNMQKITDATPQDRDAWQFKRVNPTVAVPNPNGSGQGVVVQVFNIVEGTASPGVYAMVRTNDGQYYIISITLLQVVG